MQTEERDKEERKKKKEERKKDNDRKKTVHCTTSALSCSLLRREAS